MSCDRSPVTQGRSVAKYPLLYGPPGIVPTRRGHSHLHHFPQEASTHSALRASLRNLWNHCLCFVFAMVFLVPCGAWFCCDRTVFIGVGHTGSVINWSRYF